MVLLCLRFVHYLAPFKRHLPEFFLRSVRCMAKIISFHPGDFLRNSGQVSLAFSWLLGLVLGAFVPLYATESVLSLMRCALYAPVSIVSLLSAALLPFLCSAIAISASAPAILLCICFLKAFSFSAVSAFVFYTFGSAGWLVRCLFLFSDIATAPLFFSFCRRHMITPPSLSLTDISVCVLAGVFCFIDWAYISPLLSELITL